MTAPSQNPEPTWRRAPIPSPEPTWRLCPHSAFAFSTIDRISIGEVGRGRKYVSLGEAFSEAHFPDAPILPGVMIIGAIACVAGAMMGSTSNEPKIRSIQRFRFLRAVIPGDLLEVEAAPLKEPGWFKGQARVSGKLVAQGRVELEC